MLRAALVARYGPETGREATAEAFVWALEHWPRARGLANPLGYLYRVGQSRARRYLRRMPLARRADVTVDAEADVDLAAALRALPERQLVAVVLRYQLDLTLTRTAQLMGISVSTAHVHVSRGLNNLRAHLGSTYAR